LTEFETALARRKPALEALQKTLAEQGVRFVQVHLPDLNGMLRSKIGPLKLGADGDAVNCNLFCVTHGEGEPIESPLFEAPVSNVGNGYPNMRGLADPASVRRHGWAPEWASVIIDSFEIDGARNPLDARAMVAAQAARAEALGYEARFALEYEFGVFQADETLMRERRYAELKPWGHGYVNYSLTRSAAYQGFFAQLIERLASIGVGAASITTEYGHGMYELALAPKPPLEAADDAVRTKLALQELCLEHGLVATFMTRFQPPGRESACGAHHHQSLWRDGRNAFAAGPGRLSDVARHYVGGLLARLAESHLVYRPTLNAYRRFDKAAWSPTDVTWGFENRTCAVRAITTPNDGAARFEHRAPGADVNPYLTVAAMLGAGLDGIEQAIEPDAVPPEPLAPTLEASIDRFEASAFAERVFGPAFKAHYLTSRRAEVAAFRQWLDSHITGFEFQRYFLSI
jgi:glutamine synthetase